MSPRVYVGHLIYKGKAALTVSPLDLQNLHNWMYVSLFLLLSFFYVLLLIDCSIIEFFFFFVIVNFAVWGVQSFYYILLQFAPVVGMCTYDWNRKQVTLASFVPILCGKT